MEIVSNFLGISIAFGVDPASNFATQPHFHARYGELNAVFDIASGDVLDGRLGERAVDFVTEWTALNRAVLLSNWHLIHENKPPLQIEPLE